MHEFHPDRRPPRDWHDAFAALPLESPDGNGWHAVAARLDERPRTRWPLWAASAAAVVLAIALPWQLLVRQPDPPAPADTTMATASNRNADAASPLETLYAESARLEALLAYARDERVSSGTAAVFASELDDQIATIDLALMRPDLTLDERRSLWQQRVDSLRVLTGFESNRRWLAAQGAQYDGAVVSID